jgi:hypothetical protein
MTSHKQAWTKGPDVSERLYQHLLYKYSHVGCPAAHYEDNCEHPGKCAENGRCLDLSRAEGGKDV